jgi:hypothetical protein
MFALVRAAGDAGTITASETFEQIGTAHRRCRSLDKAPARESSLKTERRPFYRRDLRKQRVETTFISSFPSLPPVQSLSPAGRSSAFGFWRVLNAARFVHFQELNFTVGARGKSAGSLWPMDRPVV